jgi:hypothetical protein
VILDPRLAEDLPVPDLSYVDPEDFYRSSRSVVLPIGSFVKTARARVVGEHPKDRLYVAEFA